MKYHHPKIAPGRRMSFNPTFRGMSVLRAMQKTGRNYKAMAKNLVYLERWKKCSRSVSITHDQGAKWLQA
jgi:hypothetical protein